MESGVILHSQFSASADLPDYGLSYARLNGPKAWLGKNTDLKQWFQVYLLKPSLITGVSMQGRQDKDEWVTRYTIKSSMDGFNWKNVTDEGGITEVPFDNEIAFNKITINVKRNTCQHFDCSALFFPF